MEGRAARGGSRQEDLDIALILDKNRLLLEQNVILTTEVINLLKEQKVLGETLAKDIMSGKTGTERISSLLEHIKLMGPRSYRKFVDILQVTGHSLLAEHLLSWERDTNLISGQHLRDELMKKFYPTFKNMQPREQNRLLTFIQNKVTQTYALGGCNERITEDKARLLTNKQDLLQAQMQHARELRETHLMISKLETEVETSKGKYLILEKENEMLQQHLESIRAEKQDAVMNMAKSIDAIDRSNRKMSQQIDDTEINIRQINLRLVSFFGGDIEEAKDDITNMRLEQVNYNIEKLIKQIKEMEMEVQDTQSQYNLEKAALFTEMSVADNGQSLAESFLAVKHNIVGDHTNILHQMKKIFDELHLNDIMELFEEELKAKTNSKSFSDVISQGLGHILKQICNLKPENISNGEDMQKEIAKLESKIIMLEMEIAKLENQQQSMSMHSDSEINVSAPQGLSLKADAKHDEDVSTLITTTKDEESPWKQTKLPPINQPDAHNSLSNQSKPSAIGNVEARSFNFKLHGQLKVQAHTIEVSKRKLSLDMSAITALPHHPSRHTSNSVIKPRRKSTNSKPNPALGLSSPNGNTKGLRPITLDPPKAEAWRNLSH